MIESIINPYLRNLFNCIKENQFDNNGNLIATIVTIKEDLIKNQTSGNFDSRDSNTNYVMGEIIVVGENYVTILANNPCSKQIIYTIFYSKILYISSFTIGKIDLNECLKLKDKELKEGLEENKDLIKTGMSINKAIEKSYDNDRNIQFIFDGIISNIHKLSSVKLIKTILIIENYYAIPLSIVDGFVLLPSCSQPNNKEEE